MQRVVGFGLIVQAAGYVFWLAFSGTPFGRGETVVINSGGASNANGAAGEANSAHELELNIVTLLGFGGIPSIENPRFVEPELRMRRTIQTNSCSVPGSTPTRFPSRIPSSGQKNSSTHHIQVHPQSSTSILLPTRRWRLELL